MRHLLNVPGLQTLAEIFCCIAPDRKHCVELLKEKLIIHSSNYLFISAISILIFQEPYISCTRSQKLKSYLSKKPQPVAKFRLKYDRRMVRLDCSQGGAIVGVAPGGAGQSMLGLDWAERRGYALAGVGAGPGVTIMTLVTDNIDTAYIASPLTYSLSLWLFR